MGKYNLTSERVKEAAEKAEKGGFQILPEGQHLIRVTGVTYKLQPNTGNEVLELQMAVVPGEPHQHETCRDSLFFSEKAMGRVLLALRALGVPNEALASFDPEDPSHQKMIEGRTAIIDVIHKTVSKPGEKDKVYANVSFAGYRSASASAVDEMRKARGGSVAGGSAGSAAIGGAADPLGDIPF